ncbi:LacI family DNA-binding transcriptional regulator [Enterococcus sp. LJL51]|uniref:LacI family DNA-binding transcriptional regulator n=1 Tax=Enterococcus sp. LJL51 TaxID=3416656 RepID=UPI003CFAB9C4
MINIRDIAEMTGVSKSTVSRVINNQKYVSDEIRKKVQQAIDETGYVANGNAVKLSNGKNYTLGVTVPYNSACYDTLVNSILFHAKEKGYQVLLLPTYYDQHAENEYYSLLERRMIDGLVLTSRASRLADWEKLSSRGRIVSTEKIDSKEIAMIYPDRKKVYHTLFNDLSKQGYSKIIFTAKRGPSQSVSAKDKLDCYQEYFGDAFEGANFFTGIEGYQSGVEWAKETFKKVAVPEIIYANADDTAAGIIVGLKEAGFIHKKDYQIIGEGNLPYSQALGFSTIDFRPTEIGSEVIEYITSDQELVQRAKEPQLIKR